MDWQRRSRSNSKAGGRCVMATWCMASGRWRLGRPETAGGAPLVTVVSEQQLGSSLKTTPDTSISRSIFCYCVSMC